MKINNTFINISNESVCAYMQQVQVTTIDAKGEHKEPNQICITLEENDKDPERFMCLTSKQARNLARQLKIMANDIDNRKR